MKKLHFGFVILALFLVSCHPGTVREKEKRLAQDWLQKGVVFEKQDIPDEAIKMYTRAIDLDKQNAEAYLRRGKATMAFHKTDTREALVDFDRVIDLDPANADAYYLRGLVHLFVINNEKALDDMRTAAKLGHNGALQWLAEEQAKGKKKNEPLKNAVFAEPQKAPEPPPYERSERVKESRASGLGQYLSSASEPVIYFDHNRADIKEQYLAILDEIAQVMKEKLPEANVVFSGYTDNTGKEKYNDLLSLRRAKAVESYLKDKQGMPSERMAVKGYGQNAPVATNETEEGREKNRRVEILIAR